MRRARKEGSYDIVVSFFESTVGEQPNQGKVRMMPPLAIKKLNKYHQVNHAGFNKKNAEEREQLVCDYAPLVKTIAGRLSLKLPSHISTDDLISAGIIGLLDAIEKFDSAKGVEFKSYAEFRIRGAMLDELRSLDWVPRSVRRNGKKLQEAYAKVEKEKMRPARDEEVAGVLGIDLETFHQFLDEVKGISIINEEEIGNILPHGEMESPWQMNRKGSMTDPFDSLRLSEVRDVISEAIEKLPKNEKTVVALYYYKELTMKEIGNVMGYTESRVSQLHTKAVLRLRGGLQNYFEN